MISMSWLDISEETRQRQLAKNRKPKPLLEHATEAKPRVCLKCGCEFVSVGDRLCETCNGKNVRESKRAGVGGGSHSTAGRERRPE